MIDENLNSIIGVNSDMVAKMHLYYRSSVLGRKHLGKQLSKSIKPLKKFKNKPEFKNRNVEILQAYLKFLGVEIKFFKKPYNIDIETGEIKTFNVSKDETFTGTITDYNNYMNRRKLEKKFNKGSIFVGSVEEYENELKGFIEEEKKRKKEKQDRKKYYNIDINI